MRPLPSLLVVVALTVACGAHGADVPPSSAPGATDDTSHAATAATTTPATAASSAAPAPAAPPSTATELLTSQRAPFEACWAKARANRPKLHKSTVTITFDVDETGRPANVGFDYKHPWDDASKNCMRDAALALQFPDGLRGKQTGTIEFLAPAQGPQ